MKKKQIKEKSKARGGGNKVSVVNEKKRGQGKI